MQLIGRTTLTALVVGALTVAGIVPAVAGEGDGWQYAGGEYCRDGSYECVREAAMSYLTALRQHDGDYARLAPEITRTLNGSSKTYQRDALAESLDDSEDPINSVHADDWVVDGANAVAFYAIDASYAERGVGVAHTWLAERFHITNGEIDVIEGVFLFAPGIGNADRGWLRGVGVETDRSELLDVATRLLDAQTTGDYANAPLAPAVRRTLNGKDTAVNRTTVEAVPAPFGPLTYGVRDTQFYADSRTGEVAVFAALDQGSAVQHATTVVLGQRFRVRSGLVTEIEQIAWPVAGTP